MKNFKMKRGMATILVCMMVAALFASEPQIASDEVTAFVIQDYAFSVKGKTKNFALRSVVIPSNGDPVFATEEDMVKALAAKKQLLVNKRLFTSVEFEYTLESVTQETAYYTATFFVEDSSTFLTIPFPKFDNDEVGLRLGVKIYDKNLLGTFSDLYISGSISQGNGGLTGWDKREDQLEMKITSLPLKKTFLDFSFDYERTKQSIDAGKFNFSFNWKNLTLKGAKLNIAPWGYFRPSSDFSVWSPQEYGVSWGLGPFKQNGSSYSLYNKLRIHAIGTQFDTYTSIDRHGLSLFSLPISFKFYVDTRKVIDASELTYAHVGVRLGTSLALPLGMRWASYVTPALHFKPSETNPLPYSFLLSNTISKSNINWTGNFRKGVYFSLSHTTDIYPQEEYRDTKTTWYIASTLSWFPIATNMFNPSIQFKGFVADAVHKRDHFSNATIADSMRGYLTKTIETFPGGALGGKREYGAIINMNLTTKFIDFGFAKSYASPFLDVGIFHDTANPEKPIIISSAGLDGWGIINKFPSYPIRGSLGFNLQDVRKAIEKEIDFTEIEWELYIGMGLFF